MSEKSDWATFKVGDVVLVEEPGREHLSFTPATVMHVNHPRYLVKLSGSERTCSVVYPNQIRAKAGQ